MTDTENGGKRMMEDGELAEVSGGKYFTNKYYDRPEDVQFRFHVGNEVEVRYFDFWTYRCVVRGVAVGKKMEYGVMRYYERYDVEPIEKHWYYASGLYDLCDIQIPGT